MQDTATLDWSLSDAIAGLHDDLGLAIADAEKHPKRRLLLGALGREFLRDIKELTHGVKSDTVDSKTAKAHCIGLREQIGYYTEAAEGAFGEQRTMELTRCLRDAVEWFSDRLLVRLDIRQQHLVAAWPGSLRNLVEAALLAANADCGEIIVRVPVTAPEIAVIEIWWPRRLVNAAYHPKYRSHSRYFAFVVAFGLELGVVVYKTCTATQEGLTMQFA